MDNIDFMEKKNTCEANFLVDVYVTFHIFCCLELANAEVLLLTPHETATWKYHGGSVLFHF